MKEKKNQHFWTEEKKIIVQREMKCLRVHARGRDCVCVSKDNNNIHFFLL